MDQIPCIDNGLVVNHLNNITNELNNMNDINSQAGQKKNLIDLKTYNGSLMLLFNEMAQTSIHYTAYWFLQYFFPILQLILLILSPFLNEIWDSESSIGQNMRYISCILSFTPSSINGSFDLIGSLIIIFIYVFIGLWFCIIPAIHLITHLYTKPILYMSVCLSQVVVPFLLIPLASNISLVANSIDSNISGSSIMLIIFYLIMFILVLLGHTFLASMNAFLITPNRSVVASYKGQHPALVLTCATIFIILSKVSILFEKWLAAVIMLIHILCNAYFIYDTFQFPFVRFGIHIFAASLYTSTIVGHIFGIMAVFGLPIPEIVHIIIPYVVFVICIIIYFFVFSSIRNNIKLVLSYTDTQTDHDRRQYYDSLNITSSLVFDKMCRIGMSTLSPLFIDWTFPIFAGEMTGNIYNLISTALFVTFFPGEQQAASYFIEQISKQPMSSFRDRFILFRVKATFLRRFSSDTEESTAAYAAATKQSDDTLNMIRQFWLRISSNPESAQMRDIEPISRQLQNTKHKWLSSIEQYPNDSRFASGYSDFLLETMVDPINGVFMKLKSGHLQKGFNADLDPVFKSFAIARPFIFHDKICDRHGNIKRNAFEITSGTTITISTTAMEKLEDDLDSGVIDKLISELYHWPNLRKSFKRATSNYKSRFHSVGVSCTIVGLVIYAILVALILAIILPIFDNDIEYFNRIQTATRLRAHVALGKVAILMRWAQEEEILFDDILYNQTLDATIRAEPGVLDTHDIKKQVAESLDLIIQTYVEFSKSFSTFMVGRTNVSSDVSVFADIVERNVCSPGGAIIYTENISLKSAIALYIYVYYQAAYVDVDFDDFAVGQLFCQSDLLMRSLPLAIDQGIVVTKQSLNENLDNNYKKILILAIAYILIFTFGLSTLFHFTLIISYFDAKNIFESLKSLESGAAHQGSELVLTSSENNDEPSLIQASENGSTYDVMMIILNVLFVVIMEVGVIVFFSTLIESNDKSKQFVDWSISGSKRLALVYEAFGQLSEAIIFRATPPHFTDSPTALSIGKSFLRSLAAAETEFFNGEGGIKGNFKDIDDLHLSDQCKAPPVAATKHDFYHCLGIDQLISSFIVYGDGITDSYIMQSTDYINLFHMTIAEVSERLQKSSDMVASHMMSNVKGQETVNIIIIALLLISIIGLIFSVNQNAKRLRRIVKVSLILFRRIPPPAIVNSKALMSVLLGPQRGSANKSALAQNVIFDTLPTAVLIISKDETIESMNEKSKQLFGFLTGQIVGQKLECLINKIDENALNQVEEVSEEDAGSIHLYSLIRNSTSDTKTIYVLCHCSDDSMVRCEASLFTVPDYNGTISNFIIFLHETGENLAMEAALKEANDEVTHLLDQLIPSDVQGFIRGDRKDFSFMSSTVTVVAIQIYQFFDAMKKNGHNCFLQNAHKLFQHFEAGCIQFPPMMKQRQFADTFISLGGLFNVTDDAKLHAQAAIQYSTQMIEDTLKAEKPFGYEFRIQIGITTGGPLMCGLVGDSIKAFDAAGPLIEEAIIIAENSQTSRILVSQNTKNLLPETEFEKGLVLEDNEAKVQTFWVPGTSNEGRIQVPVNVSSSFIVRKESSGPPSKKIPTSKMKSILCQPDHEGIAEDDVGNENEYDENGEPISSQLIAEMSHPDLFDQISKY